MSSSIRVANADVTVGDSVTPIVLDVTLNRVMLTPASTLDYFPGHHLVSYAQEEQGLRTIYLNTMSLQGLLDRTALEWAGQEWFIRRRKMSIHSSVYAETVVTASGVVLRVEQDALGLELEVRDGAGARLVSGEVDLVRGSAGRTKMRTVTEQ